MSRIVTYICTPKSITLVLYVLEMCYSLIIDQLKAENSIMVTNVYVYKFVILSYNSEERCENRTFGMNCNIPCQFGCATDWCRKRDGWCPACIDQYYGDHCEKKCDNCVSCDKETGCIKCIDGYYGLKCEKKCPDVCATKSCDRRDGRCDCAAGYAGHPCKPCPLNCHNMTCNAQFQCQGCRQGYYGQFCDRRCPSSCNTATCGQESGTCECKVGFAGLKCIPCPENCIGGCSNDFICEACKAGFYGKICNNSCPEHCDHCIKETGGCDKCIFGYWGVACSMECSENCISKQCRKADGDCICKSGFGGRHCSKFSIPKVDFYSKKLILCRKFFPGFTGR